MSVGELDRLACSTRRLANVLHALHFKIAEYSVMSVFSVLTSEEAEEQKYVTNIDAVVGKVGLSGSRLAESAAATFEHRIVVAEARSGQPTFGDLLDILAKAKNAVGSQGPPLRRNR